VRLLQIVIGSGCAGSDTARAFATDLCGLALPDVTIALVDVTEPEAVRPESVFAIPTYILDGRIVSLGNPEYAWIVALLRQDSAAVAAPAAAGSPVDRGGRSDG
jgi:hypothetical protein